MGEGGYGFSGSLMQSSAFTTKKKSSKDFEDSKATLLKETLA